ncbi:hypothetical protein LAUMK4_00657 [Mycobacterium persicum]|uniref:Secreted protein n=1 Tax=Mycobacterium persicum TaxID=1487726 RepID=A0ABY6RD08_9MYCO|nr:hypothetical protein LAUMK15_01011 [Mycobacterium persicum]VAZ88303.1 hypothetical protein LAUMK4_00657 [Mycobacterium persicum]
MAAGAASLVGRVVRGVAAWKVLAATVVWGVAQEGGTDSWPIEPALRAAAETCPPRTPPARMVAPESDLAMEFSGASRAGATLGTVSATGCATPEIKPRLFSVLMIPLAMPLTPVTEPIVEYQANRASRAVKSSLRILGSFKVLTKTPNS